MLGIVAAALLALSPVIPLPEAELYPAGDAPGTWDHIFTHDELAVARAAGGLTGELRQLIQQRLTAPIESPSKPRNGTARTPTPAGVEQWRGAVAEYGWPVNEALAVMACESGGVASAYNPSGATGLFQIKPFWTSAYPGDLWDGADNIRIAYQIWANEGGWSHWTCKP